MTFPIRDSELEAIVALRVPSYSLSAMLNVPPTNSSLAVMLAVALGASVSDRL